MKRYLHIAALLLVGYILGVFLPGPGQAVKAKVTGQ